MSRLFKLLLSFFVVCLCLSKASALAPFLSTNLTYGNGTDFIEPTLIALTFSTDDPTLLLLATYTGKVLLLRVFQPAADKFVVNSILDTVQVGEQRFILGAVADPFTPDTFFISTAIHNYISKVIDPVTGWQNGQVKILRIQKPSMKLSFDTKPLISGLPVSNSESGLYNVAVDSADGSLFVSVSAFSNAGVPTGNITEHLLSGSILRAPKLRQPGSRLQIKWTSTNPFITRPVKGTPISVYAFGFRSVFQPIISLANNLIINDGGGSPQFGPKSLTCTTQGEAIVESDRIIRVLRGRWYGMANRARGVKDPAQCRYIWGDESDIEDLKLKYPSYTPPLFTTLKARQDNLLGSGTVGFIQYNANWAEGLRGKFLGGEFDELTARPGRPLPNLYAVDLHKRKGYVRKVADTPGVSLDISQYGAIFAAQFNIGKVAIAIPTPRRFMKREIKIRNVWPTRAKSGSVVSIVGTLLPKDKQVYVGGKLCVKLGKVGRKYGFLRIIKCRVPVMTMYNGKAVDVSVDDVMLKKALVVLNPQIKLVD